MIGIDYTHPAQKEGRVVGKEKVDLLGDFTDPLKLIEADNRRAVFSSKDAGKKLLHGEGGVPDQSDVPFHAAAGPGVANCQVAGANDVIAVQKLLTCSLVYKRPELASYRGDKGSFNLVIFQNSGEHLLLLQLSGILIPVGVGENVLKGAIANVEVVVVSHNMALAVLKVTHAENSGEGGLAI